MNRTNWDAYAEANPPTMLREPQQRRGAAPRPMLGLSDEKPLRGEPRKFTKRFSVRNEPRGRRQ